MFSLVCQVMQADVEPVVLPHAVTKAVMSAVGHAFDIGPIGALWPVGL